MYDFYINGKLVPMVRKCTLFTAKMAAMDISDKENVQVDILDHETGEVLAVYSMGLLVYEAA